LSQILLISYYLPGRLLKQMRRVLEHFPPESYPKLYPISVGKIQSALGVFKKMNIIILICGLGVLLHNYFSQSTELLNWDNQAVLTAYYLLQMTPLLLLEFMGVKYFRLMKEADKNTTRKAILQSRNLFDFVSPVLVGSATVIYLAFIGLIQYIKQTPFDGFGGDLNILIITLVNVFFGILVFRSLYGKKRNPHQTNEDRVQGIKSYVSLLFIVSIAVTAYAGLTISLQSFGMQDFRPVTLCIYFQFITLLSYKVYRFGSADFEVYKSKLTAT
jgi:hypothetical protein